MRGHIRQRGERSWAVVVDLPPDPATGKRRQKWHSVKGTKRDAERCLGELLHQLNTQQYAEPTRLTLAQYLEDWLAHKASTVSRTTWLSYAGIVRSHIIPALGHLPLTALTPLHVQHWLQQQLASGRADGRGEGLSHRTVQYSHAILFRALRHAARLQLVTRNAAEAVQPPSLQRREFPVLDTGVAVRLLDAARGTRLYVPVFLAVSTGLRRGEILGLRWSDVDLGRCTAEIRQTLIAVGSRWAFAQPKTSRARRRVALPASTVTALRVHRQEQDGHRRQLGPAYRGHDLVVCLADGRPWDPRTFAHGFERLIARAGAGHLRFHDLRHLHATVLLRQGVHPKVVADRLGHSQIRVTLDTYSHVMPDLQHGAAQAFDAALAECAPDTQRDGSAT